MIAPLSAFALAALDRFAPPVATSSIGHAPPRACVIVDVRVERVELRSWVGGPVLEAMVEDGSGSLVLAFLGRRAVAGVEPGRDLVAAGTVAVHDGRRVIMNPLIWLKPTCEMGEA